MTVDANGNVLVAGEAPGGTNAPGDNAFVRKLSGEGVLLWTYQFDSSNTSGASVSVDADGNVYVAGNTFDALPGQTSAGGLDAFVRKLSGEGEPLWTHQFGSSKIDGASSVSVDADGNVLVAGGTEGSLAGQTNSGGYDAFVRKLSGEGEPLWTQQFGSSKSDGASSVSVDADGNVYVAGDTSGALPGQTNSGGYDAFVRKLSGAGAPIWTHQFGSSANDHGQSMSADADGNVLVAGNTYGSLPGQTSAGDYDAFVHKLSCDGVPLWTHQFGSSSDDAGLSVSIDADGNVFVTGYSFGSLPGQTNAGSYDAFVRKLSGAGVPLWTHQFGSSASDVGHSVSVDADGNVFVAGVTYGSLPGQTNAGDYDAFVTVGCSGLSLASSEAQRPGRRTRSVHAGLRELPRARADGYGLGLVAARACRARCARPKTAAEDRCWPTRTGRSSPQKRV